MHKICPSILKISEKVIEAVSKCKPVVALQSTIISHGMPYPQNKQCALSIQNKIIQQGAIPATVAIFDGKIHVGLDESQIQRLAQTGQQVRKVSRRDLPYIIASKGIGATTVSATMIAAHAAGIDLFVTGGIGGVHRGFEHTMDVSADLDQLARTPITVVSAGVKSILDIPRTLEYLQTKGVPVMTYKSKYFPAFFSSSSGLASPFVIQSQLEGAKIIYAHQQLGLQNGLLVAVPNSNPSQGQSIQKAIQESIKQSQQQKISGAKITPFLLKRVNELTKGKSLQSNISLVHNNAAVGGKIAVQLAKLKQQTRQKLSSKKISMNISSSSSKCSNDGTKKCGKCSKCSNQNKTKCTHTHTTQHTSSTTNSQQSSGKIVAIGGAAVDYQLKAAQGYKLQLYKSCVGSSRKSLGGVARNIADCAAKLGVNVSLIAAIGNDQQSSIIRQFCSKNRINLVPIQPSNNNSNNNNSIDNKSSSAKYFSILDQSNNQLLGISQMYINDILTFDRIHQAYFKQQESLPSDSPNKITQNDIIVLDSNILQEQIKKIAQYCTDKYRCLIFFQAKGQKSKKIITSGAYQYINVLKMNQLERIQVENALKREGKQYGDIYRWLAQNIGSKSKYQEHEVKCIITNGAQNAKIVSKSKQSKQFQIKQIKVPKVNKVQKTTGAGDTFAGTFCSMLLKGKSTEDALKYAVAASKINIENPVAESVISDKLIMSNLEKVIKQELIDI